MPEFEIVPTGMLEGAVFAALEMHPDMTDAPIDAPDLFHAFKSRLAPGVRGLLLRGAFPWGREDLNRALLFLLSAEDFDGKAIWAERLVTARDWPAVELHWVIDVSPLLAEATNPRKLVADMADLPYIPRPAELVLYDPEMSNLHPAILDEIATRLDSDFNGTIYITDPDSQMKHVAEKAVLGCATRWSLRWRTGGEEES